MPQIEKTTPTTRANLPHAKRASPDNFSSPVPPVPPPQLILNYLVSLADLSLGILRRGRFVHVWNAIQDFDSAHKLDEPDPETGQRLGPLLRRTKRWLWTGMVASVLVWTTINQLGMRAFNEPYLKNVGYLLTYISTCVAVFKVCGIVYLLGQRFGYLNGLVREQIQRIQEQQQQQREQEVPMARAIVKVSGLLLGRWASVLQGRRHTSWMIYNRAGCIATLLLWGSRVLHRSMPLAVCGGGGGVFCKAMSEVRCAPLVYQYTFV